MPRVANFAAESTVLAEAKRHQASVSRADDAPTEGSVSAAVTSRPAPAHESSGNLSDIAGSTVNVKSTFLDVNWYTDSESGQRFSLGNSRA